MVIPLPPGVFPGIAQNCGSRTAKAPGVSVSDKGRPRILSTAAGTDRGHVVNPEMAALQPYLGWRSGGLPVGTPAVRP